MLDGVSAAMVVVVLGCGVKFRCFLGNTGIALTRDSVTTTAPSSSILSVLLETYELGCMEKRDGELLLPLLPFNETSIALSARR
jgi:hypothetical protein